MKIGITHIPGVQIGFEYFHEANFSYRLGLSEELDYYIVINMFIIRFIFKW